jgi:hypothetical protein
VTSGASGWWIVIPIVMSTIQAMLLARLITSSLMDDWAGRRVRDIVVDYAMLAAVMFCLTGTWVLWMLRSG